MLKKILVPMDGSPLAELSLQRAAALAENSDTELVLLRMPVSSYEEIDPEVESPAVLSELQARDVEDCQDYLQQAALPLAGRGIKCHVVVLSGHPEDIICAAAESHGADLIVMSTHGRTGWQRWRLGSVAEYVAHHTRVPVMLVREQPALPTDYDRRMTREEVLARERDSRMVFWPRLVE